jgi:hypothetical protein
MKKFLKVAFLGFLVWLICFIIGFIVWPLHESHFMFFKSIMVVSSTIVGILLLAHHFRGISSNFVKEGIVVGVIWFVVNIVLDLIVLVGILKTPLVEYLISPGIGYLNMPVISIGIGYILSRKK